ncbi:hypothetical protein SBV1_1700016 [Verrucomicrobia bacterium]|nr:hypothetical protein SBV1_1700016 [Verrucomicrobiota bacterium]
MRKSLELKSVLSSLETCARESLRAERGGDLRSEIRGGTPSLFSLDGRWFIMASSGEMKGTISPIDERVSRTRV